MHHNVNELLGREVVIVRHPDDRVVNRMVKPPSFYVLKTAARTEGVQNPESRENQFSLEVVHVTPMEHVWHVIMSKCLGWNHNFTLFTLAKFSSALRGYHFCCSEKQQSHNIFIKELLCKMPSKPYI